MQKKDYVSKHFTVFSSLEKNMVMFFQKDERDSPKTCA